MITIAKCEKTVADKSFGYFIVKNVPGVLLAHTKAEKKEHENFAFVILLSSFFYFHSFFIRHNSKTIVYV